MLGWQSPGTPTTQNKRGRLTCRSGCAVLTGHFVLARGSTVTPACLLLRGPAHDARRCTHIRKLRPTHRRISGCTGPFHASHHAQLHKPPMQCNKHTYLCCTRAPANVPVSLQVESGYVSLPAAMQHILSSLRCGLCPPQHTHHTCQDQHTASDLRRHTCRLCSYCTHHSCGGCRTPGPVWHVSDRSVGPGAATCPIAHVTVSS